MPLFAETPTIYVTKAIYDATREDKKNWGVELPQFIYGGWDWWYYASVSLGRSGFPNGYTFKWQFYAWKKWGENVRYGQASESFLEKENGLYKVVDANKEYTPPATSTDPNVYVNVPAYNGQTWYYWFDIINIVGKTYTISYNGNGNTGTETTDSTSAIYPNNVPIATNNFIKTGYSFVGWATSSSTASVYNQRSTITHPETADTLQLYAVWSGNKYGIYYYANGGTGTVPQPGYTEGTYGSDVTLIANPFTKIGYTFSGWGTSAAATSSSYSNSQKFSYNIVGPLSLYAFWVLNNYIINYNANGGTGSTAQTSASYDVLNLYISPNSFTRTGYVFVGWGTDTTNVNSYYNPGYYITNPQTNTTLQLYAIWGFNITYSSTINSITTTTIVPSIGASNFGIFPNNLLTKNNQFPYIFKGWGYTSTDTNPIISFSLVSNITLYAIWDTNNGVSFYSIQKLFGGNYPIYLSEYYLNKGLVYSPGGIGIPISGLPIKLSQIIGKYKSPYISTQIVSGNTSANMDETNAIQMFNGAISNNGSSTINVGFPFYWFNIDYGTNSNIKWDANNALTFGSAEQNIWVYPLQATTYSGIFMGYYERLLYNAIEFNSYRIGGFNVKRFIVKSSDYYQFPFNPLIIMEIILMRNSIKQYIEIKLNKWTSTQVGVWSISDGTNFYNIFSKITTKLTGGSSVILSSTLTGTGWVEANESLVLPTISIETLINSSNLLLYLDGYDINGTQNFGLSSSSKIQKWVNLANTALIATQDTITSQPLYTSTTDPSVAFTSFFYNALVSDINLHSYSQINIFIVLKKTSITNNLNKWIWNVSSEGKTIYGRSLFYIDNNVNTGSSYLVLTAGDGQQYYFIYKLPLSKIVVLNCEYNSNGNLGRLSINGNYVNFNNTTYTMNSLIKLYIGSNTSTGNINSFVGTIHEFIVINRILLDTERRTINNFLYTKWNVDVFDDIKGMGTNLVLHNDAKNVNGDSNVSLTTNSKITSWYNLSTANYLIPIDDIGSLLVTYPPVASEGPNYTNNSIVFTNGNRLLSTCGLNKYQKVNIFIVLRISSTPNGNYIWYSASTSPLTLRSYVLWNGWNSGIGVGDNDIKTINYPYPSSAVIINCEYNSVGELGTFFINNDLKASFICTSPTRNTVTYFGSLNTGVSAFNGIFYEIIVIDRLLSVTERKNIYTLLKAKWNIIDDEPITSMGANLVLRNHARNIDGSNNSTFTSTTAYPISSWYNSANTATTTTQTIAYKQPTYNISAYGVEFGGYKYLLNNIDITSNDPTINIFVVWKMTQAVTNVYGLIIFNDTNEGRSIRILRTNNIIRIRHGYNVDTTVSKKEIGNPFPYQAVNPNPILIYNIEYNTVNQPGKFFINNTNYVNFTTLISRDPYYGVITDKLFVGGGWVNDAPGCKIYEFIVINRLLSDAERTNIYNSLVNSWGQY